MSKQNSPATGLDPIEKASRDELQALQLQRMKWSLKHAYDNVPHYRKKYDAAGVHPDDLKQLSDLAKFPFTTKLDLRDTYPFGMFATPMRDIVRIHASSGTTGKPTVVAYTKNDIAMWAGLMARSLRAAGCSADDIILNSYGYGLFTGGLGAHYGAECLGATVIPMSGGQTEKQIQLIQDFKPTVIMATPSYMLTIADEMDALGIAPKASSLRVGMFGAEPWSAAMREEIETRIGLRATDMYGLSEIMGPGVACECECRNGLHGWEDHFLFEVIDPETGRPLPEGEAGELVITTLTKQALPMLRYRTRDITRLSTTACDCGRTHVRILRIAGRNDDMMIIRGVNVYPSQIEAVLLGLPKLSPHYLLVLERRGTLDEVSIEIEAQSGVDAKDYPQLALDAAHRIKSMIGITTEITVQAPETIARSQGKAVRLRDLRPKGQQ